jgi:hypothetical protein
MHSLEMKKLFWEVFCHNSENNLHQTVIENKYLNDPNNWYPYGGKNKNDRSNFCTFENQQAHSGSALVEKITNSIDALLLKKCKQQRIDPKSQDAPKTIEQATQQFFNIPKGDIGELLSKERTQMARENIQIIATGDKDKPDLMIYDNGEGQHPDNFKNTFLSIANNNKTDIAFVQGKYNMGSTGAVVFCGKYRYQLIASKMDEEIFKQQKQHNKNLFGWTLVRRHVLTDEENIQYGSSWYEYFAINGTIIPQFEINKLDIGLYGDKQFTTGSFIKLFSYEMPKGAKGAIYEGIYQEFNQLLYKPALPFWLLEKREHYKKRQKLDIAVYGNHVRINNPDENILERKPIYEKFIDDEIGEVDVQAVIFEKGQNPQQQSDRKRRFIGSKRNVIYTLNGQVHGNEGQAFITQELQYNFLKNSMLVVINCSKIKTEFRQDLFMANRSNLRQNDKLEKLNSKVIEILKGNEVLRQLNIKRKNAILQGGDDKKEKELIENLLSKVPLDKSLTNLLKKGMDLINLPPQKEKIINKGEGQKKPQDTQRFPSIFKINIKENQSGKKIKSIPLDGKGVIKFETNVAEDYFYRSQEKGEFHIYILEGRERSTDISVNPNPNPNDNRIADIFEVNQSGPIDGSIKLTLKPKDNLNVGDEIELNAKLTSPDGDMESVFYVKIINPQKQENTNTKKEPEKPELPQLIKITKKDNGWIQDNGEIWSEDGWDENSIIHIIPAEEEKKTVSAIAINMNSHSLTKYLSKNKAKTETEIDYLKNQYISKIYLHGLFLYSILDKLKAQQNSQEKYTNDNQSSEDLLAQIFKNYSDVLIHLDTNKEILDSFDDR